MSSKRPMSRSNGGFQVPIIGERPLSFGAPPIIDRMIASESAADQFRVRIFEDAQRGLVAAIERCGDIPGAANPCIALTADGPRALLGALGAFDPAHLLPIDEASRDTGEGSLDASIAALSTRLKSARAVWRAAFELERIES